MIPATCQTAERLFVFTTLVLHSNCGALHFLYYVPLKQPQTYFDWSSVLYITALYLDCGQQILCILVKFKLSEVWDMQYNCIYLQSCTSLYH